MSDNFHSWLLLEYKDQHVSVPQKKNQIGKTFIYNLQIS